MRYRARGWRSSRQIATAPAAVARDAVAYAVPQPATPQEPLRLGLGLAGLVFYLWVIHSYKLSAGDIAVIATGLGVLLRSRKVRVPPQLMVFGLFILWSAFTLTVTLNAATSAQALIDLIKLWVISFFVINIVQTAAELRLLTIAWLAVFALYPIRGALFNQFICRCNEGGRAAWNFIFENPNDLAALTLFPIGVAAALAVVERHRLYRLCARIGVAVLAMVILMTQSRGAMIAMGVAVIALLVSSRRRGRDLLVLIVVGGGAAIIAPKGVWVRLAGLENISAEANMANVDPEGSAEGRWILWEIAGSVVRDNPITGIGVGTMPEANRMIAQQRGAVLSARGSRDTHNTYLRVAAELGIPGLLIYLAMWGFAIAKLRQARAATRHVRPREHQFLTFLQMSIVAYLVASVFGTYSSLAFTYLALAYIWLASDILSREPWYVSSRNAIAGAPNDFEPKSGPRLRRSQ